MPSRRGRAQVERGRSTRLGRVAPQNGDWSRHTLAMDSELFIQLLGVFGLGSLLTMAVSMREQKRQFRASVITAVGRVEDARWASEASSNFSTAAHELQTAALMAGLPREVVQAYLILAQAAFSESWADFEEKGVEGLYPGSIHPDHSNIVRRAAELIIQQVWSPWRSLLWWRRGEALKLVAEAERIPKFARRVAAGKTLWGVAAD